MNTETNETISTAQAFADSCGLEYKAEFVPLSQSRNAGEKLPTVNWKVTVKKGNQSITCDYSQGVAHLKGYKQGDRAFLQINGQKIACEKGIVNTTERNGYLKAIAPTLVDVLYSLVMDSDVLNYSSFEDWADNLGYDTDSRKAESIYQACMTTALQLRQMIDLEAAAEAFQDY